jgi:hypothetical protein
MVAFDTFELRVRNEQRELLAFETPKTICGGAFRHGLARSRHACATRTPARRDSLEWTQPWINGIELEGSFQPAEFTLSAEKSRFLLRPTRPVNVRGFAAHIRHSRRSLVT